MIDCMESKDKLDGSNYNLWHLQVQFALNDGDMLNLLTSSMLAPVDKYYRGRDILLLSSTKRTQRHTKPGPNVIVLHATQCCLAWRTISWVSLNGSPLLRTCGRILRSGSGRHL